MSSIFNSLKRGSTILYNALFSNPVQAAMSVNATQTRNLGYINRMMLKDIKRREAVRKYTAERVRLTTLKSNRILPKALKEMAGEQLSKMHLDSKIGHINDRCAMTSRAANCLSRWRISRLVWRSLVDYNQMSGVQRATWGTPTRNSATFVYGRYRPTNFNTEGYKKQLVIDQNGKRKEVTFRFVH